MPSFLDFNLADSANLPAKMRIPITTQALPTGVSAYAAAVAAAAFGSTLPLLGAVKGCNLVITGVIPAQVAVGACEARNSWAATMTDSVPDLFRFSLPTRNPLTGLLTDGVGEQAATGLPAWTALLSALLNTAGTIHMENGKTGSVASAWGPVLSQTRARKRPRIGGRR